MCAGLLSSYGIILLIISNNAQIAHWGAVISSLSILMLFLGQRIAKDYAGAGNLVGYFIASVVAILLTA
jgi:hypothetical protein